MPSLTTTLLKPLASLIVSSSLILSPVDARDLSNPVMSMLLVADDNTALEPTDQQKQLVQIAFRDYNSKRFDASNEEFTQAIKIWKDDLHRPRDEIVSLLKARANVRLDKKDFTAALEDYNKCLELMGNDGETAKGLGTYPEYPDTFVGKHIYQSTSYLSI